MPINWVNGGAPAINATNLNALAVTADVATAGTPTGDALRAAFEQVLPAPAGGGADDTATLQAAINAAPTGARLTAPRGASYSVSTLTVNKRLTLDFTTATVTQRASTTGDLLSVTGAGATVRGGIWDGNVTNQTAAQNRGISVAADDVTVSGVTVQNTKFTGIYNTGGNRFLARDCKVINTGYCGIFAEPNTTTPVAYSDVTIENCYVDRSMLAASSIVEGGLKLHATGGTVLLTRAKVRGCTVLMPTSPIDGTSICIELVDAPGGIVSGCHTSGGAMGISAAACDRAVISGNPRVFNAKTYGIEIPASKKAVVSGNSIDGNGLTPRGIVLDVASSTTSDGTLITGNTVVGCTTVSIDIQDAMRVAITGNTVESSGGGSYLLNLATSDHATVVGNTLDGLGAATKAVVLDTTSYTTVSGNAIRNCTQNGVSLYSANAGYTIQTVAVTGNVFDSIPSNVATQVSGGAVVGSGIVSLGNAGFPDFIDLGKSIIRATGPGSPNGAVYGGVGSTWLRQDGGAGTTFYVKESGDGTTNTGWVAK